jgi:very-short-patch-repair endonuclease
LKTTYQKLVAESKRAVLELRFAWLWVHVIKGPIITSEHKFHPTRKWRFDFAHLPTKTAIEIEGGIYSQGRHQRIQGFKDDAEKYFEAGLLGWRVFRLSSNMVTAKDLERIAAFIKQQPILN